MANNILVIGMHRSGTSALTRALNLMGWNVGPTEGMMKPSPEQPHGYWEQEPLRQRNDSLLACRMSAWDRVDETHIADALRFAIDHSRRSFTNAFYCQEPWVWKDPRNCLLLDHWFEVFETCGGDPSIIFIFRHPEEVADSLARWRGTDRDKALDLWRIYNVRALEILAGRTVYFVDYERLLREPMKVLGKIGASLGCMTGRLDEAARSIDGVAHTARNRAGDGGGDLYQGLRALPWKCEAPSVETIERQGRVVA
jgi:hypothetical protein